MEETIVSLATSVPQNLIGTHWFYFYKCGTNVLLILSIKCNPKKYESTNHFEKYKGIKKRDMCGNTKCQCA